jgi:hypothetical protein
MTDKKLMKNKIAGQYEEVLGGPPLGDAVLRSTIAVLLQQLYQLRADASDPRVQSILRVPEINISTWRNSLQQPGVEPPVSMATLKK